MSIRPIPIAQPPAILPPPLVTPHAINVMDVSALVNDYASSDSLSEHSMLPLPVDKVETPLPVNPLPVSTASPHLDNDSAATVRKRPRDDSAEPTPAVSLSEKLPPTFIARPTSSLPSTPSPETNEQDQSQDSDAKRRKTSPQVEPPLSPQSTQPQAPNQPQHHSKQNSQQTNDK